MPDDELEVTEQTEEGDFDKVFGEDPPAETPSEEEEPEAEEESEEEPEEEPEKEEPEEEESEEDPEKEEPEAEEEEPEDEALTRGRELMEEEEESRRAAETAQAEDQRKETPAPQPVAPGLINALSSLVSKDILPEGALEVNGVEVDLRDYLSDNPEVSAIVGIGFRQGMNRLIESGRIMTSDQVEETVSKAVFEATVTSQHRDAPKIVQSDEWGKWFDEEATDEEKALFRSKNPMDHVLGLERFKNRATVKKAREKKEARDKEAKEAHGKHKDVHKHTGRSRTATPSSKPSSDDFDAAFDEAAEKEVA